MSESPGAMGFMPKRTQIEQRDADTTGSIAARAAPARNQPSYATQNPPPSAVETARNAGANLNRRRRISTPRPR